MSSITNESQNKSVAFLIAAAYVLAEEIAEDAWNSKPTSHSEASQEDAG